MKGRVFLFGEAEKGELCTPLRLQSTIDLYEQLGEPPEGSLGIDYAVQTLSFKKELIFYRVREEGFNTEDYMRGVKLLYNHGHKFSLCAICIPGLGDPKIIESLAHLCRSLGLILLFSERDLYDYLSSLGETPKY